MSPQPPIPESKSPFWRFSIKFYQVPGVPPACIELQDQAGVDVNVLFFLLWLATQNRALNNQDRKSTRLNSSHSQQSRMPSSA